MQTFYTFAVDEYGIGYDAETFHTVEDAESYLEQLKDQAENCTNCSLSAMIASLEDQLLEYKELTD